MTEFQHTREKLVIPLVEEAARAWAANLQVGNVFQAAETTATQFIDSLPPAQGEYLRWGPQAAWDRLRAAFVTEALRALDARRVEVILDAETGVIIELRQVR